MALLKLTAQARQPILSVVMAVRNDAHEGAFTMRVRRQLQHLLRSVAAADVAAEIVFVEWNPPDDKPPFRSVIADLVDDTTIVRVISVPPEFHRAFENSNEFGMFEFIAKSVGIRRAKGDFILITNPDILLPEELFGFAAAGKLERGTIYRACRVNLPQPPASVDSAVGVDEYLDWIHTLPLDDILHLVACVSLPRVRISNGCMCGFGWAAGDFMLAHRAVWARTGMGPHWATNFYMDSVGLGVLSAAQPRGVREVTFEWPVRHQWHSAGLSKETWSFLINDPVPVCDHVCCGGIDQVGGWKGIQIYDDDWGFPAEEFAEERL
jgi:hypothetical protein